jgi:CelD/BcsL family acetyltransferase involved in cellulose biosynthesis
MSQPAQALLDDRRVLLPPIGPARARSASSPVEVAIYEDLDTIELEWRRFQANAEGYAFQSFDWLAPWQAHVGRRENAKPAIVIGRAEGEMLFLIPLAVTPGVVRRLSFLGSALCDYNAPMLAADFSERVGPEQFPELWRTICTRLQNMPEHRHDLIDLTRMPETIGAQRNPFLALGTALHPSGAHLMELHGPWEDFYQSKRSSVTRRRDRSKRKRLEEMGEVRFVEPQGADAVGRTVEALMAQKSAAFARMGVTNIFDRPGYREFFLDAATNAGARGLVHVSRVDVGATWAAINLGLQFQDRYYHVLASYDEGEVARFGPGAAHLRDLISRAIGLGLRQFDFTVGDERYKFEWADTALKLYDHIAAATPLGWVVSHQKVALRRVKRFIKQNEQLFGLLTRARSQLAALRAPRP